MPIGARTERAAENSQHAGMSTLPKETVDQLIADDGYGGRPFPATGSKADAQSCSEADSLSKVRNGSGSEISSLPSRSGVPI